MNAQGTTMDIRPTSRAQEYLEILQDLWPLAVISGTLAMMTFGHHVRRSYLQRSPGQFIVNMLWSSGIAMALVVGTVTLLDFFEPQLSASVEVGIAIAIGIGGIKTIDFFTRKYFGLKVTDYMDPDLIHQDKSCMTPEERQQHCCHCPFHDECPKTTEGKE